MANKGKRRIAPKYGPLTVDGDGWVVRLNPPLSTYGDLQSGDLDRIGSALSLIVSEHPYVGDDDQPLSIGDLDMDTVTTFVEAYGKLMTALPPDSPPAT